MSTKPFSQIVAEDTPIQLHIHRASPLLRDTAYYKYDAAPHETIKASRIANATKKVVKPAKPDKMANLARMQDNAANERPIFDGLDIDESALSARQMAFFADVLGLPV